jgi:hypothetical protein
LIVAPDPALAPVIPPVIAPIDQVKVLDTDAARLIPGPAPLHVLAVLAVVTTGDGLTVIVIVYGDPMHKPTVEVGVTM